jgi:O-methyltransferase
MRILERIRLARRVQSFRHTHSKNADLMRHFSRIDKNIIGQHSPAELIFMADVILRLDVPGSIVECGCWKGSSSAKLSHVAARTNRRLFVCDTFEGLPPQEETHTRIDGRIRHFKSGEFSGTLREVQANIRAWGNVESCEFVKGLFSDTLPGLDVNPAVVFMDVDYVSSARDCLKHLWPRLQPGGLFFTHEAAFVEFIEGITDGSWWTNELSQCPPPMFGAGYGVDPIAPYLAYFRKPQNASKVGGGDGQSSS